jgi:hypothetical protein
MAGMHLKGGNGVSMRVSSVQAEQWRLDLIHQLCFFRQWHDFSGKGNGAMADSAIHTDSNQPAYNHHSTSLGVYSLFFCSLVLV